MCNRLHTDYEKISPEGKAYKLVCLDSTQRWTSLVHRDLYKFSIDRWVCWNDSLLYPTLTGFCFIPTLEEALRVYKEWGEWIRINQLSRPPHEILEVDYRQGLGKFMELHFIGELPIEILLAKEFKVVRKVHP